MADTQVANMTEDTNPGNDSLLYTEDDPAGTPVDRKATAANANAGLILLEQQTASSSASLDFASWYSSSHDEYLITLMDIVPGTDTDNLHLLVSTDGGSSFLSGGGTYAVVDHAIGSDSSHIAAGGAQNPIILTASMESSPTLPVSANIKLFDPGNSSFYTAMYMELVYIASTGVYVLRRSLKYYKATTPVNAFQIIASSGNLASGSVYVYGYRK